ncbi:MAG: hypothetical protein WD426_08050 [Anditalea sp.]
MRWVALAMGLFFTLLAVTGPDALTGIFGAFFLFQAITNSGCLGSQACAVPAEKPGDHEPSDINFTEIKDS